MVKSLENFKNRAPVQSNEEILDLGTAGGILDQILRFFEILGRKIVIQREEKAIITQKKY